MTNPNKTRALQRVDNSLPCESFKWRTARGEKLHVSSMKTSHLFNTLKMIWNNFMPTEARVHPIKLYSFSDFYTEQYLEDAIVSICKELFSRQDLNTWQLKILNKMAEYFKKYKEYADPARVTNTLKLS